MSASGTIKRMRTAEGVAYVARVFLGVDLTTEAAERYVVPRWPIINGLEWFSWDGGTSVGPVVYRVRPNWGQISTSDL